MKLKKGFEVKKPEPDGEFKNLPEKTVNKGLSKGRTMSRTAAKKQFTKKGCKQNMRDKGIHVVTPSGDFRDECGAAYKDIGQVMKDQKDLVKIVTHLHPVAVVKG